MCVCFQAVCVCVFRSMHPSLLGSGSWDGVELPRVAAFEELCACEDFACQEEWLAVREKPLVSAFGALLLSQLVLGWIAWTLLEHPDEIRRKLNNAQAAAMSNVASSLKAVKAVGEGVKDLPGNIASLDAGSLTTMKSGVTGFVLGPDEIDEPPPEHEQAMMITNSVYFEVSVLSSVVVAMVVLAMQSKAAPPLGDLGLTLRILEIFVTIYLSAEMALEFFTAMTRMRQLQWLRSPWTWIEITVLAVSWSYILSPDSRFVDICRVLRIMRPIRSLRLFHSIGTICQCFAEDFQAFLDVCILTVFVLFLTSLVAVHLFSGAIQNVCLDASLSEENVTDLPEYGRHVFWAGQNISVQEYCPATLSCAVATEQELLCASYSSVGGEVNPVGEDESGYRGFDALGPALLTMFIHM